ncbi:MAG: ABC transporter ATP-binding protein [Ruminococcus sp.]|nr:ABC transporter ATP-binding protein [Ruminococcus sp.]
MIEIKNLTKYYGNTAAVRNLSFTAKNGEVLGFLGPNGAGKSTTMNMLTGFLPITSGTVTIDGLDNIKDAKTAKQTIGYMPEIPPLYMDMRVKEYLKFVASIRGVPRSEKKAQIADAMEKLKITDKAKKVIRTLSKGYKQRVGFAQALLGQPHNIILDEPTAGLDPAQIIEVRELIKDLGKTRTVILSSHILQEITSVCDRIVIISGGELRAYDTPDNLARLSGQNSVITLTAEGSRDKIIKLIRKTKGFISVLDIDQKNLNSYIFKIEVEKSDVRKELLKILVNEDIAVSDVSAADVSLEEIFVKLTSGSNTRSSRDIINDLNKELEEENSEKEEEKISEKQEDAK